MALGAGLGMIITAEGVATREQLDLLRDLGLNEVQGSCISRPETLCELFQASGAR